MAIDISSRPNKNIRRVTIPSKKQNGISFLILIIIALCTVVFDCLANVFINNINEVLYILLKLIGQASVPLMCFITAQVYMYTQKVKNLAIILGILAIISHIPYVLLSTGKFDIISKTSLMLPLFLGYSALMIRDMPTVDRNVKNAVILLACLISIAGQGGGIAVIWTYIFGSGISKNKQLKYFSIAGVVMVILNFIVNLGLEFWFIALYQLGFFLAVPFIMKYNSNKSRNMEKDFYKIAVYPIIILIFAVIRYVIR